MCIISPTQFHNKDLQHATNLFQALSDVCRYNDKNSLLFQSLTSYSIPLCVQINKFLIQLARKFPSAKFLKSVSTNCIQNYPDKNVPTIFVYCGGQVKGQFIGPHAFGGMQLDQDCKCCLITLQYFSVLFILNPSCMALIQIKSVSEKIQSNCD